MKLSDKEMGRKWDTEINKVRNDESDPFINSTLQQNYIYIFLNPILTFKNSKYDPQDEFEPQNEN